MKLRRYFQLGTLVGAGVVITLLFLHTAPGRYFAPTGTQCVLNVSPYGYQYYYLNHTGQQESLLSGGSGRDTSRHKADKKQKGGRGAPNRCQLSVSGLMHELASRGVGWLSRDDRLMMQQLLQLEWASDGGFLHKFQEYFYRKRPPEQVRGYPITSQFVVPRVLMQPRNACPDRGKAPFLLILVPSVPSHRYTRQAIRETWGSPAYSRYPPWPKAKAVIEKIKIVFVLGTSSKDYVSALERENARYQDLLRFDFHDSYLNLTVKIMSALHWASTSCRRAAYVAKVDEDTLVNVPLLQRLLHMVSRLTNHFILGHVISNSGVQRNGKWAVSSKLYPPMRYPNYLVGHSYVMPSSVVRDLLRAAKRYHQPLLPIEDSFITGILSGLAKVKKLHLDAMAGTSRHVLGCAVINNVYVTQTHFTAQALKRLWYDARHGCTRKGNHRLTKYHSPRLRHK